MLLYVKFQPGIEVNWLEVNLAGAKFLEIVAVHVTINNYGYVVWHIEEKISYL